MNPRSVVPLEPVADPDHSLKAELYSLVRGDSAIFEFLQTGSLDGIWYLDLENPGGGWMSSRYKEVLGYRDDEIPNTASWWRQNAFPEDLPAVLENFAQHCADPNTPFDQILRHKHKNGSAVWIRCRGLAIRDATGRPIRMLGAHTNVTALKQSEGRLRAIFEASPEIAFVIDLQSGGITECNQAFRENCGAARANGMSFIDLCERGSVQRAESTLDSLRTNPKIKDIELSLKGKNDATLTVLFSAQTAIDPLTGRPIANALCRDISHLKQSANIEALIGTLPSGILLADQQGRISTTNTVADQMFGCAKGELIGKPLASLLRKSAEGDTRGLRKDGSLFLLHLELNTLQLGDGVFQAATVVDLAARKGIESALRESEHRFRQITESLAQLVWITRADGACDYLSPQWVRYTGIDEGQQLESGWLNQIHPDDRDGVLLKWSACVGSGSPFSAEFRIRRQDGEYCWFDARAVPLRDAENRIVKWFGASTDITDLKNVEADQRFLIDLGTDLQTAATPEAVLEVTTRSLSDGFHVECCALYSVDTALDQATRLHVHPPSGPVSLPPVAPMEEWGDRGLIDSLWEGKVTAINETATHPHTAGHYAGSLHPAGVEALLAVPLRREGRWVSVLILVSGQTRRWTQREMDLARTAGERIWLAYEAARSLAAERAMNANLAASEQRLQIALQSAAIGIWENVPGSGVNHWDARSRSIFGFPPDLRITGEMVMSCVHPDDRQRVQQSVKDYRDVNGTGHFEAEYRIISWNGTGIRHIYAQGQMFFEGEGEQRRAKRAIGTVQDVTALKRGEQALRRANLELERFAYAAAHDLQEPLRNVGLASQILSNRYAGKFDKDADALLKITSEGALRMQAMVKDLLAYSRAVVLEEGAVLLADPQSVLSSALKNLALAIEEKQAEIQAQQALPQLKMSETHLLQLFQNLIGNSLKYSGPEQPKIEIGTWWRAGECVLFVKDNGLGIPAEYHERAFGVFKRLHKTDVPGTGIGLALCKRIVEHYGGRIWLESEVDKGTTVLFAVPVADGDQNEKA